MGDTHVVSMKTNGDYMCKFKMFQIRRDLIIFKNFLAAKQI